VKDESEVRLSIAIAIKELASDMASTDLPPFLEFLIATGFSNPKDDVRGKLVEVSQYF